MARNDYVPNGINDYLAWHDNFTAMMKAEGLARGFTQAEIDATVAFNADIHAKAKAASDAEKASKAANSARRASFKSSEDDTRAKADRLKGRPEYDESVGQSWGVIGPEDTTDLSTAKPKLRVESIMPGEVTIGFNKSISDGVMIYSKRGGEANFVMLAWDTQSPYVDNRPNLGPNPETREYRAIYLKKDKAIGQHSDVLVVTVPA